MAEQKTEITLSADPPNFLQHECAIFCRDNWSGGEEMAFEFDTLADCEKMCIATHEEFGEAHVGDAWHWWDEVPD
jgi:hypothetical protein